MPSLLGSGTVPDSAENSKQMLKQPSFQAFSIDTLGTQSRSN